MKSIKVLLFVVIVAYTTESLRAQNETPYNCYSAPFLTEVPTLLARECSQWHTMALSPYVDAIPADAFSNSSYILSNIYCLSALPPHSECEFSDNEYYYTILNVPQGSRIAYSEAPVWKNFYHVKGIDIASQGEVSIERDQIYIKIGNSAITVIGADEKAPVAIYTLAGEKICQTLNKSINNLSRGLYILQVAGRTFKISI